MAIETWLNGYDAAFNANDLDKLATFYHLPQADRRGSRRRAGKLIAFRARSL
jgi:hypothetical protein